MKLFTTLLLALLTPLLALAQPVNDNCSSAIEITLGTGGSCGPATSTSLSGATASGAMSGSCISSTDEDIWYTFTPTTEVTKFQKLSGDDFIIAVYENMCYNLNELHCKYFFSSNSAEYYSDLSIGETYYLRITDYDENSFSFCIEAISLATNNDCANAITVPVGSGSCGDEQSIDWETYSKSGEPNSTCSSIMDRQDAWFKAIAPSSGSIALIQTVNDYARLTVYENVCGSLNEVSCGYITTSIDTNYITSLNSGQNYFLRISSSSSSWDDGTLSFCLQEGPAIYSNQDCASAASITVESTNCSSTEYINFGLATPSGSLPSCITNNISDVWYSFVSPTSGSIELDAQSGNASVAIYGNACGSLTEEFCETNIGTGGVVVSGLTSGTTYYLQLLSSSTFDFCLLEGPVAPANDDCTGAIPLTVQSGSCGTSTNFDFTGATLSSQPSLCGNNIIYDLWYTFTAPTSGSIEISNLSGGVYRTVYSATCGGLIEEACVSGSDIAGLSPGVVYYLRLSTYGIFSGDFCLLENSLSPPANDVCASATPMTDGDVYSFNNTDAAYESSGPDDCEFNQHDIWFSFVAPASGNVELDRTMNGPPNFDFALFSGDCGTPVFESCNYDAQPKFPGLSAGVTYYLQVYHVNHSQQGTDEFEFNALPASLPNGTCETAIPKTITSTCPDDEVTVDFDVESESGVVPSCSYSSINRDVWYSIVAPSNGTFLIDFSSSAAFLALYENNCGSLTEIQCKDNSPYLFESLTPGNTYLLQLTKPSGSVTFCASEFTYVANDECTGAISVNVSPDSCGATTNVDLENATDSNESSATCLDDVDLWYSFSGPDSGELYFHHSSGHGMDMGLYTGSCGSLTEIFCESSSSGNYKYIGGLVDGETYLLRFAGSTNTNFDFCLYSIMPPPPPPAHSDCNQSISISESPETCMGALSSTNIGASSSSGDFCPGEVQTAVFFDFSPTASANFTIKTSNASDPQQVSVFTDCSLSSALACGQDSVNLTMNSGTTYYIAVYPASSGNNSSFDICAFQSVSSGDGNVGIDISNPLVKLQVNGGILPGPSDVQISGNIRFGSVLQVFQNGAWQDLVGWDHMATQDISMSGNDINMAGGSIDMANGKIENLPTPVGSNDAATKSYVDAHQDNDADDTNELVTALNFSSGYLYLHQPGANDPIVDLNSLSDGLGSHFATQDINMNTYKVTNMGSPTSNSDAATKQYVDSEITTVNADISNVQDQLDDHELDDGDLDSSNELQTITKTGTTVTLSDGGGSFTDAVDDADNDATNEIQTLVKSGPTISLSNGGGSITDDVDDADSDPNNEIQTIVKIGSTVTLNQGGGSFTDDNTTYSGADFAISNQGCPTGKVIGSIAANGTIICVTDEVDDADNDPTNEIDTWSTLAGIPSGFADDTDDVDDADNDPANEDDSADGVTILGDGITTPFYVDDTAISPDWSNVQNIPSGFADDTDNVDDADNDPSNEDDSADGITILGDGITTPFSVDEAAIQPDWSNVQNIPSGFDDDTDDVDDADNDPSNEDDSADGITILGDGITTPFSVDEAAIQPDWSNVQNIPSGFADDTDNVDDADNDPSNEDDSADGITILGDGITTPFSVDEAAIEPDWSNVQNIPAGFSDNIDNVKDADYDDTNELQTINKVGAIVTLSHGGGTFTDNFIDADADPDNEIQTVSKTGSTVTLSDGGGSFTDEVDDADNDPNNEFQTISKTGNTVTLSDSGGSFTDDVDDADNDPTNEAISALTRSGTDITITENGIDFTISMDTFSNTFITDGTVVSYPESTSHDFVFGDDELPTSGSTTANLFFFDESLAAFRAGKINSSFWNTSSLGASSFATGENTEASGISSFAAGNGSVASGDYALAMGNFTDATNSAATAFGYQTLSSGTNSFSAGHQTTASGSHSVALGSNSEASATASTAMGIMTEASGLYATALGRNTKAESRTSLAIGRFNVGGGSGTSWNAGDPLFEIGNGTDASNLSNAMTVLKNGDVGIGGNPGSNIHVYHATNAGNDGIKIESTGANGNWWRFYVNNSSGNLMLYADGVSTIGYFDDASGTYSATSDRRLKKNFTDLHFSWKEFMALKPLSYQYKADSEQKFYMGMVAQDVEKIYPEMVSYSAEEDVYHMDYTGFGVVAIKAIQEQQKIIDQQARTIQQQEERLQKVEAMLESLLEKEN